MALGEYQIFTWKSRAAQDKEQEDYEKWAFPFGESQRENLRVLLRAVYPKVSLPAVLIPFLTCKELYESILKKTGSCDATLDTLINKQKKYKRIIGKKHMTTYIALVQADARIDERCEYPSAAEICASARELDKLRKDWRSPR